jgi:hypothetical protein
MDDSRGLIQLEEVVLGACSGQAEWPARIAAGVYAGVDFAIAHPEIFEGFASNLDSEAEKIARHRDLILRFTGFLQAQAPASKRLPGSTDAALVGGVVDLVRDYLRLGRADHLEELRSDLVLLVLLPYLGFAEAKSWANRVDPVD